MSGKVFSIVNQNHMLVHNFNVGRINKKVRKWKRELNRRINPNTVQYHADNPQPQIEDMINPNRLRGREVKDMIEEYQVLAINPYPKEDNIDLFGPKSFFMTKNFGEYIFEVIWHIKGFPNKQVTIMHPYRELKIYSNKNVAIFWESFWNKLRNGIMHSINHENNPVELEPE